MLQNYGNAIEFRIYLYTSRKAAVESARHSNFEINFIYICYREISMSNLMVLTLIITEISTLKQTDAHGTINSASYSY